MIMQYNDTHRKDMPREVVMVSGDSSLRTGVSWVLVLFSINEITGKSLFLFDRFGRVSALQPITIRINKIYDTGKPYT